MNFQGARATGNEKLGYTYTWREGEKRARERERVSSCKIAQKNVTMILSSIEKENHCKRKNAEAIKREHDV